MWESYGTGGIGSVKFWYQIFRDSKPIISAEAAVIERWRWFQAGK